MRTKAREKKAFWAWLPALLVVVGSIITAAGVSLLPSATAASSNSSVAVSGAVDAGIAFDPATCTSTNFGASTWTSGGGALVSNACVVEYQTNNSAGAVLSVTDNRGAAGPFFCHATNGCGGANQFDDKAAGASALADGTFGVALAGLAGVGGDAAPVAAGSFVNDATPLATDPIWLPVTDASQNVCSTSAASNNGSQCTLVFAGDAKSPQNSGNYSGQANLTATTN